LFWLFARGAVAVCCRRHSDPPLRWTDLVCLCRLLSCSSFLRFGLYCHTEFVAFLPPPICRTATFLPSVLMLASRRPSVLFSRRLTDLRLTLFAVDLMFHRSWIFSRRLFRGSAVSCSPSPPLPFAARRRLLNCSRPPRLKICWNCSIQLNSGRLPKPTL